MCERILGPRDFMEMDAEAIVSTAMGDYRPRGWGIMVQCSKTKPYTRSPVVVRLKSHLSRAGLWPPRGYDFFVASDAWCLVPIQRAELEPFICYDVKPSDLEDPAYREHLLKVCRAALSRLRGVYVAVVAKELRRVMSEASHEGLELQFYTYASNYTRFREPVEALKKLYMERGGGRFF